MIKRAATLPQTACGDSSQSTNQPTNQPTNKKTDRHMKPCPSPQNLFHQPLISIQELIMKRISHFLLMFCVALTCSNPLFAVNSSMEVNISLTIPASLDIVWYGDADGAGGGAAAEFATEVAWPIGTAALSGTYETFTPTNGGGGSFTFNTAYPLVLRNKSNTNVTIQAIMVAANAGTTASSTTVWDGSANGSVTANTFNLKVAVGAANAGAIDSGQSLAWNKGTTTGTATVGLIGSLANGADSGRVDFQLKTPDSITLGGGTAQRMIVRFTASVAP
jgi:hypothetical protein